MTVLLTKPAPIATLHVVKNVSHLITEITAELTQKIASWETLCKQHPELKAFSCPEVESLREQKRAIELVMGMNEVEISTVVRKAYSELVLASTCKDIREGAQKDLRILSFILGIQKYKDLLKPKFVMYSN